MIITMRMIIITIVNVIVIIHIVVLGTGAFVLYVLTPVWLFSIVIKQWDRIGKNMLATDN